MSKFYDTMHDLGYEVELERRKPGFESFIRREEKFNLVIFFYFNDKKMKGYVIPKILFTKIEEVNELRENMVSLKETLIYLKSLSNYDIMN